jgi:hypothetical protein
VRRNDVYVPVRKILDRPGCYFNRYGYVLVRTKPGFFELEHRMVVERALGRKLSSDEEVNHINGLKFDNSNSNLFVSNHEYHTAWHQRCKQRFGTWHPPVVRNPAGECRKVYLAAVPLEPSEQEIYHHKSTRHSKPLPRPDARTIASIMRAELGLVCDA